MGRVELKLFKGDIKTLPLDMIVILAATHEDSEAIEKDIIDHKLEVAVKKTITYTNDGIYTDDEFDLDKLYNYYYDTLDYLKEKNYHSVAFPAFPQNISSYIKKQAAGVAVMAITEWFKAQYADNIKVVIADLNEEDYTIYKEAISNIQTSDYYILETGDYDIPKPYDNIKYTKLYKERYSKMLIDIFGTDNMDIIYKEHSQDYKKIIVAKYLNEKAEYKITDKIIESLRDDLEEYYDVDLPWYFYDITEYFYEMWGTPLGLEYEDFIMDLKKYFKQKDDEHE